MNLDELRAIARERLTAVGQAASLEAKMELALEEAQGEATLATERLRRARAVWREAEDAVKREERKEEQK